MVKVISHIKRRQGLDREGFLQAWREQYLPALRALPHIQKVTTNIPLLMPEREPRFDVVLETYWREPEEIFKSWHSEFGSKVEDVLEQIADVNTIIRGLYSERVIIEPPRDRPQLRNFGLIYRDPRMTFEQFDRHWRENHAALVRHVPKVRGYMQCSAFQSAKISNQPDGCAISYFDNVQENRVAAHSPEMARVKADEKGFLLSERVINLATTILE